MQMDYELCMTDFNQLSPDPSDTWPQEEGREEWSPICCCLLFSKTMPQKELTKRDKPASASEVRGKNKWVFLAQYKDDIHFLATHRAGIWLMARRSRCKNELLLENISVEYIFSFQLQMSSALAVQSTSFFLLFSWSCCASVPAHCLLSHCLAPPFKHKMSQLTVVYKDRSWAGEATAVFQDMFRIRNFKYLLQILKPNEIWM